MKISNILRTSSKVALRLFTQEQIEKQGRKQVSKLKPKWRRIIAAAIALGLAVGSGFGWISDEQVHKIEETTEFIIVE